MKKRLIERLDLLAEISEAAWIREIARHIRALEQATEQRRLLGAYRDKLRQSWRSGAVVDAAAARRAADFVAASQSAEHRIDQMERQAAQQLDRARLGFAEAQERRRGLAAARREAVATTERSIARRLERLQGATKPRSPP